MGFEPPVVVYDACVLYPFHLRNLLVQCAFDRLVEARWTDAIHEEWIRNLLENNDGLTRKRLLRTRDRMNEVLPSANVVGYERHVSGISLPDPDDRHVLASGIACGASVILTWNGKDFPRKELGKHGIVTKRPDAFLVNLYGAKPDVVLSVVANARRNLRKTNPSPQDFVESLKRQKLVSFSRILREKHVDEI